MNQPPSPTPHKFGANRNEPARKSQRAKNLSESRDIHEDRSTLESRFGRPERAPSLVRVRVQTNPETTRAQVRRDPGSVAAKARLSLERGSGSKPHVVHLRFFRNDARDVYVAGTFNDWQPAKTPLRQKETGEWEIALSLAPGDYEYRFVADGEWLDDPLAGRRVANPYGGENAVLHVHGA